MSVKFLSNNLVNSSLITASSVNAQFPLSNIKDNRRTKVYRSLSNNDSIVFDFGENAPIDSFAIVGDSLNSFGFSTIKLQLNAVNNWVNPAFEIDIPIDDSFNFASVMFEKVNYRFARLVVSSSLGYCELANLFIGKATTLDSNDISYPLQYKQTTLKNETTNQLGQKFIDAYGTQKSFAGSINTLTIDEIDIILDMLDLNSTTKPMFVIFDSDNILNNTNRLNGYYYLTSDSELEYVLGNYWNLPLSFIEVT